MEVPHYKRPATYKEVMIDMPEIDLSGVVTDVALEAIESGNLTHSFWRDPKGNLAILKLLKEQTIDGNLFTTAHLFWNTIHRIDGKEAYEIVSLESEKAEQLIRSVKYISYDTFNQFKARVLSRSLLETQFIVLSERAPSSKLEDISPKFFRASSSSVLVVPFSFFQEWIGVNYKFPIRLIPSFGLTSFQILARQASDNSRAFSLHGCPDNSEILKAHGLRIHSEENLSSHHDFDHGAVMSAIHPDSRLLALNFRNVLLSASIMSLDASKNFTDAADLIADFDFRPCEANGLGFWFARVLEAMPNIFTDIPTLLKACELERFTLTDLLYDPKVRTYIDSLSPHELIQLEKTHPTLSHECTKRLALRIEEGKFSIDEIIKADLFHTIIHQFSADYLLKLIQSNYRDRTLGAIKRKGDIESIINKFLYSGYRSYVGILCELNLDPNNYFDEESLIKASRSAFECDKRSRLIADFSAFLEAIFSEPQAKRVRYK